MEMASVPVVLDVNSIAFAATHKYDSSMAMLLDFCEWSTNETGSVHENGINARYFKMDLPSAYQLVNEWIYIGGHFSPSESVLWIHARQAIDILVEGQYWVLTTDSDGFVKAQCFESYESAWDTYSLVEQEYMAASGIFESCGVCGEYGHRVKDHDDDDDEYTGPTYPEYDE